MEAPRVAWPRILLFGGSTTEYSFGKNGAWGATLANRMRRKCDVIARGFRGYNSRWVRLILPRLVGSQDAPDTAVVVIFLGTNDSSNPNLSKLHVPIEEYRANLTAMVLYLESIGISKNKVILVGCQACDDDTYAQDCKRRGLPMSKANKKSREYSEACESVAGQCGVDFVDLYSAMMARQDWRSLLVDGLHFSPPGARLLFDLLWPLVQHKTRHLSTIFPLVPQINHENPEQSLLPPQSSKL